MKEYRMVAYVLFFMVLFSWGVAGAKTVDGVVNINTASAEELMLLPGIGASKAKAIVDYRGTKRFEKTEELKNVKGIGDKLFASLETHITTTDPTTAKIVDIKKKPGGAGSN